MPLEDEHVPLVLCGKNLARQVQRVSRVRTLRRSQLRRGCEGQVAKHSLGPCS